MQETTGEANLGCDQHLNDGGESAKRVKEGKHSAHIQRRKENGATELQTGVTDQCCGKNSVK